MTKPQATSSIRAMARLEVQIGDGERRVVDLDGEITRLGRSEANDVQLMDARVSKQHAEIRGSADGFEIIDTGSRAGVFVNGERALRRALADGDEVTFGPFRPPSAVYRCSPGTIAANTIAGRSSVLSTFSGHGSREGLESLGKFLEFSRVFAGGVALADVLDQVVDVAMEITGAERGSLILLQPDGHLDFEVIRERGKGSVPRTGYRVSETIVRDVVAQGRPRVVSDIADDHGLAQAHSVVSLQLGSAVAIPLWRFTLGQSDGRARSTDEVFGVLYLDSRSRHDVFSKFDIGMLESLARDASSAIENARLLREAEDKRKFEREIETAREVQASLLPESYWTEPHFEVAGSCVPCLELGGDYIDQFRLQDGRVGIVVADVCGKGLPAALLAAALQGAISAEIVRDQPLGAVVERVNRVIARCARLGDFISVLCCVLSPNGELTYVNAGHCPLMLVSNGGVQSLVTGGIALGIIDTIDYEAHTLQMQPGDTAVLYTDGVLEAANGKDELFGEERLDHTLEECATCTASQTSDRILRAVETFRGEHPVDDDITLMVLKFLGA